MEVSLLPEQKTIDSAYSIALEMAHESPCTRRQYGAVIFLSEGAGVTVGCNERVSKCCNDGCLRDAFGIQHAEATDVGGEIHAEQVVLIKNGMRKIDQFIVLAGIKKGKELIEADDYPCYSCARIIKFAGFPTVYINRAEGVCPVSIEAILEYYEECWKGRLEIGVS